MVVVGCLFIP